MADDTPTLVEFLLSGAKDIDGNPLVDGLVYFYEAGTTKLKTVWTDETAFSDSPSPAVLDAAGVGILFGLGLYKIVVCNSDGAIIKTIDALPLGRDSNDTFAAAVVPLFLNGIPDAVGNLLTEGHATNSDLGTVTITSVANAVQVKTAVGSGNDLSIYDKNNVLIRTIPTFVMGSPHREAGSSVFGQRPQVLSEGLAGFRLTDGSFACGGHLVWTETSGIVSATGLFRDPQMTQKHPADILLGSRGEVVAYGIGDFSFTVKDAAGTTMWTFSRCLGKFLSASISAFKFFRLTFEHLTTEAANQYLLLGAITLSDAGGIVTPQTMDDAAQPTGPGVSHVEDGWTITASNEYLAYPGWRCFDNQALDYPWVTPNDTSTLPITLDMSSADPYTLIKYTLIRASWAATRSPKTWTLHGSNTGAFAGEETLLHTVTDFVWTTNSQEWTL